MNYRNSNERIMVDAETSIEKHARATMYNPQTINFQVNNEF